MHINIPDAISVNYIMLWKITYCTAIILLCIDYYYNCHGRSFSVHMVSSILSWKLDKPHGNIIHGFIISIPLSKILPWFHYHCQSHIWTSIASLPWYMFYMNTHVPDINSGKPHRAQSSNKELLYTLTHCVLLFIICTIIILSVFLIHLGIHFGFGLVGDNHFTVCGAGVHIFHPMHITVSTSYMPFFQGSIFSFSLSTKSCNSCNIPA